MQTPSQLSGMDWGNWGKYPKEFNPSIHGPYNPAKYYGKADIPFGDVKIGELGGWIARRDKGPIRLSQMISRAYWRWQQKYVLPKRAGVAPFFQVTVAAMIFFYVLNYPRLKWHGKYKYH